MPRGVAGCAAPASAGGQGARPVDACDGSRAGAACAANRAGRKAAGAGNRITAGSPNLTDEVGHLCVFPIKFGPQTGPGKADAAETGGPLFYIDTKRLKTLALFYSAEKPLDRHVINPLLKPKGHPTKSRPAATSDSRPLPHHS